MMRRVLFFVLIAVVSIGAAWAIAHIPGHVSASFGSITIETSAPVAILGLIVLAIVIILIWSLCRWIISLPARGHTWHAQRQRHLGEKAVTRLLVALAADDKREAWREARRARRLLGESPYTLLLTAEAGRMSGRDEEATRAFLALASRRDARFLGLRGLLRQAVAREDWAEAMQLAKQAEETRPGTAWVRQERAELALRTENWAEALELAGDDGKRTAYYIAAADAETDSARALAYAKQAWKRDPTFAPAVLAYAQRLRANGQERRAASVIMKTWKQAPQPDLAAFLLATVADATARYQLAKRLVSHNPNDPESHLLMARVALDAGILADARQHVEALQKDGVLQRRMYLLIAELEELEAGDTEAGRRAQREALRHAAVAEPDSRWQCSTCRSDFDAWHPKCPVCHSISTISWVVSRPAERAPVIEQLPAQVA
ncbi:MAG TPA: heme biosynthesis HemY N-terminal domain-containing protein [Rhodopila sp.]|nr:heme biosynthesis HemY N-terminal domain-containing protein [Rhodopila sp.]